MTGKRVVFCTFGSLGDLYPFLALACELKRRGLTPVIATTPVYRQQVESAGIEFRPVRPDVDVHDPEVLRLAMDRNTGGRYLICNVILPNLRDSYADIAAAADGAHLVVTHPMMLSAFLYVRRTGVPWASTALAPISLYSIYDPPVLTGVPFAGKIAAMRPFWQRLMLKAISALFEPQWKPFRALEKELGLERSPNPLFWGHSPNLVLALFSPVLAAPQRDWPLHAHATGFPFYAHGLGNPPELEQFLNAGAPPIVFTLGSAAVGVAGDFYAASIEAVRSLGCRAVLLVGRDPANQPKRPLPPEVIAVPYAPHAAIFPRASVIVHQGGIGTTGEAMRAGRPMLVVPYSHDQPDHAARLARLGVARTIDRDRYTAATAARELKALLEDRSYAFRAAEIGARLTREDGVTAACDHLVRLLPESSKERLLEVG